MLGSLFRVVPRRAGLLVAVVLGLQCARSNIDDRHIVEHE